MGFYQSKRAKPEVEPTEADLRWAAGVLDGEGSFGFNRTPSVRAFQSNRNKELLEGLLCFFGGTIRETGPKGRQVQWIWGLYGQPAYALMKRLRPYLGPYRQGQIDRALHAADARVTWTDERRQAKADDARQRLARYNIGRVISAETRQRMAVTSKIWWANSSPEKKAKMLANLVPGNPAAKRGRPNLAGTPYERRAAKIGRAKQGSPEYLEQRRQARRGKTNSPEHRAKISVAITKHWKTRKKEEH